MGDRQTYVNERLQDRVEELEAREKSLAKIAAVLRATLERIKRETDDELTFTMIGKLCKETDAFAVSTGVDELIVVEVKALIEEMKKNMNPKQNGAP